MFDNISLVMTPKMLFSLYHFLISVVVIMAAQAH